MLREFEIEVYTVVDLACNGGHLLVALTTAGFKLIGVDVSAPALALAAEKPRRKRNYTARISATLRLYLRTR
ncbi:MAG: class I SAM-dependent methyltransferase [Pseudomonadota bacterium]|nr:class I SAM-dependent methyltransferase [Pseudomonadota bacterium]